MDFEQLQVIWDSQNDEPLYAVNEAALHTIVRRRKVQEHRRTAWCYGRDIAINAVMGVVMWVVAGLLAWADRDWLQSLSWIGVPVSPWHAAALAVGGGIWIYCAHYMWSARRRQLQREASMAATLQGDLERASAHVAFQIAIARSIVWWGLLPSWLSAGLGVAVIFHLGGFPAWTYAMMIVVMAAAFAFALACQHSVIRLRHEPRQRELEALRAKLADQQR